MSNKLKCPICKTENAMVEVDVCQFCGSLEGMDLSKVEILREWKNIDVLVFKTSQVSVELDV